jgi:hypothetical protein
MREVHLLRCEHEHLEIVPCPDHVCDDNHMSVICRDCSFVVDSIVGDE